MKKLTVILSCILLFGFLSSCGPAVPKKEMEDAKTSIERAKNVDAPIYAQQVFNDAQKDYDDASNYIIAKKNKEATEKAVSSKDKADSSYETARESRANGIYQKCSVLMDSAVKNLADKIYPDKYNDIKTNLDGIKSSIDAKDFDPAYSNGISLQPRIQQLIDDSAAQMEKARNAIAQAQDKYDSAENNDLIKEYALADLKKAVPVMDEAKKASDEGNIDSAITNSAEAITIIDGAISNANDRYQKYLDQKKADEEAAALEKQKEIDAQKQKAEQYIDEAKKKLEELKSRKKTGLLEIHLKNFTFLKPGFILISQEVTNDTNAENTNINSEETNLPPLEVKFSNTDDQSLTDKNEAPETNISPDVEPSASQPESQTNTNVNYTVETVEQYINMAEDSYRNEEYLDAIDFAREAIRIADILIAMQEEEEAKALALAQSNTNIAETNAAETNAVETNIIQPSAPTNVQPPEEEFKIYVVKLNKQNRDCLWKISGYMYNKRYWLWPVIWRANKYQIKDPDLIYPGQELKIPTAPMKSKK